MIILIDGYNVLKNVEKGDFISDEQRRGFIKKLAAYQKVRSHKKIMVVFDGGPCSWPSQEKVRGITVVYSGTERTADEYIQSFLKEHKSKAQNIILVSTDRELNHSASDYNIASIDADEFYKLLQQAISPQKIIKETDKKAIKMTQDSTPELDALMEQASSTVQPKKDDTVEPQDNGSEKLSKKDRALLKKLKKL